MIWIALEVLGTRFMVRRRLLHQSCVARFGGTESTVGVLICAVIVLWTGRGD